MAAGHDTDISVHYENEVAWISINRAEKLNAIRMATYRELIEALRDADASSDCRIIVLRGEGDHFTAGNDLSDLVGPDQQGLISCVRDIFYTTSNLKKVLISAVEGVAVGIGTTILLHCDLVVASRKAKFRVPFANLGVSPEGGSSVLLSLAIGQKRAREVLLTGRFFSAEEAHCWGLVNRMAEPGNTEAAVRDLVATLLEQPQESLLATKELMRQSQPEVRAIIDQELEKFEALLQTPQTRGRIEGYLKK